MAKQNPRYAKPSTCGGCSLADRGLGFAPPSGPASARLTFIGEALGWEEAIAGEPFYGAAGGVLSRVCTRAGIDRRQARIANVISCQPPGDYLVGAPWEEHALAYCRQYLQPVLDQVPDNGVVVPLGATALQAVLNLRGQDGIAVKDFHGCVQRSVDDRYWVVPSFHPSHLQRGAMSLLEVVTQDLRVADRISQHGFTRSPSQLVVDPHPDWFVRWIDDHLARLAADPEGVHLAVDTEYAEKGGGVDESEVVVAAGSVSPITRINGAHDRLTGWTVPYRSPYKEHFDRLLVGTYAHQGWIWAWNKYADLDHLQRAGHPIVNACWVDAMWLWHYLQSDLPRGLGFVAPMASDFGAWKHWGKVKAREGEYAAADGVQTWRTAMWLLTAATQTGLWPIFLRDWHERDVYVLRPAHDQGVPVNRGALEQFHQALQVKLGSVLDRLKATAAQGVLKPKGGYSRTPTVTCTACQGTGRDEPEATDEDGPRVPCFVCHGAKRIPQTTPPQTVLGTPKKGGAEAKSQYMLEGVRLVEREIEIDVNVCYSCPQIQRGEEAPIVPATHNCLRRKSRKRAVAPGNSTDGGIVSTATADIRSVRRRVRRYFWQLPFNPDAPAQVLAYLAQQGIEAPVDKKRTGADGRKAKTTNKKALAGLAKQHQDDPFFQLQLDWKAVQKVDATYAVGSLHRLDADDRLHPTFLPKPSTFRDSCQDPNLQNVVADKAGPDGLASGFRRCVEARDGLPPGVTEAELAAWSTRWLT